MAAPKHSTPRRPSRTLRGAIFARDGYRCAYCGGSGDLTTDHVLAWSRGGETLASNLVCCCMTCNETKAGWPVDLFAELCERDGKGRKGAILRRIFRLLSRPLPKP